jgi:phosphatidylglycerophosphate synthase
MVNKVRDEYDCPIDVQIYKFIDTHLHIYFHLGLTPNMVTTFSIIAGLLSAHQILRGHFEIAALLMLLAYYFDCVDGKLARKYNMVSKIGDLYDHLGDLFKFIALFYALFESNRKKTSNRQRLLIGIILGLALMQCIHFGYQEAIYDKKDESPFLNMCRQMVDFDKTPEKTIQYTKYFGCGTWMLCFAGLILFWRK